MNSKLVFCQFLILFFFISSCNSNQAETTIQPLWDKTGYLDTINVYEFVIDPNDNLYLGGSYGLCKSTDHGKSWRHLTVTSPDTDFAFALAVDKNGYLLVGNDYYAHRSTNQGLSWSVIYSKDVSTSHISTIDVFGDTIFIAQNRGNWVRSINNGLSWTTLSARSDGMEDLIKSNDGRLVGGSRFGGIWQSFDNGDSWEGVIGCATWSLAKTASGNLFAATENCGILRSTDDGDSWTSIGPETSLLYRILTVSDTYLITAGESGKIWFSVDQGNTWVDKTDNFDMRSIWGVAMDSQDYIYIAARASDWDLSDTTYVYRTHLSRLMSP